MDKRQHAVDGFSQEAMRESHNPACYAYALRQSGDTDASDAVVARAVAAVAPKQEYERYRREMTALLYSADRADTRRAVIHALRTLGAPPGAATFNKLIDRSRDLADARTWLAEMKAAGVAPNEVTYNTLEPASWAAVMMASILVLRAINASTRRLLISHTTNGFGDALQ